MPVNSTHSQYNLFLPKWLRAREIISGEDTLKTAAEKYIPRPEALNQDEYRKYIARSVFFNATARTADGYIGMIFRRDPQIKLPSAGSPSGAAMGLLSNDADLSGTSITQYAKNIVDEVITVGRVGTLIDWSNSEGRPYFSAYHAEDILNWQCSRIDSRNLLTLLVLREAIPSPSGDLFAPSQLIQLRVYRLIVPPSGPPVTSVELWRQSTEKNKDEPQWYIHETHPLLRAGRPLTMIPFVFHSPSHSRPDICKLPLDDIIAVNLDHFRLTADFRHGIHFTAQPTAWVSGFDTETPLKIGSSTAWVTNTVGAAAGYLEFKGHGLGTFKDVLEAAEKLMAVLGARLLESQKRAVETAEALTIRQTGESSVLASLANSCSRSLTEALHWAYWWNSTEKSPAEIGSDKVLLQLNTDYEAAGMDSQQLTAIVSAWQAGAISRDSMMTLFRQGEILRPGLSNAEESKLITIEHSRK